jgi:hypothetical protein
VLRIALAKAAEDSAANTAAQITLTKNIFIAGQRPWVVYDYSATKITSPLFLDINRGGRMDLQFSVRNTGQTIAKDVAIYAAMFFLGPKHTDALEEQKKQCDWLRHFATPFNAMTIVPSPTFSPFPTTTILVDRAAIAEALEGQENKVDKILILTIVGCIDYQSVFEQPHHQTPFIFKLGTTSQTTNIPLAIEPIHLNQSPIPVDQLRIEKFTFYGDYSD